MAASKITKIKVHTMKLTNTIRKQIVANMVIAIFQERINQFEKEMIAFTRETVFSELNDDIEWYKTVPEAQKRLIPAYSTFAITAKPHATEDNKYPRCICIQPEIRVDVKTNYKKTDKNNLILKVGKYSPTHYPSDIKKLPLGGVIPASSQVLVIRFNDKEVPQACQKFFELKKKKSDLEVEIRDLGLNVYNALLSCPNVKKAVEAMPNIKKHLPEDLQSEPKTKVVPKELYDNINKLIAA